ncbi:hypothetical protein Tco_0001785 [Tanacetum coccineum]
MGNVRQGQSYGNSDDPTMVEVLGEEDGTEGPMIIVAEIGGHFIHRIYVDGGSASEILYEHCFNRLRPEHSTSTWMNFVVVRSPSPHNGIIRRPGKLEDRTWVPQHLVEHHLNVQEGCSPVRQKKRSQAPERNKAILEEVGKFMDAGIMKEVHYHSWLSNPVMVKSTTTVGECV